jgi:hypothetical protein
MLHSSVSGIVDYFAATEDESFEMTRECVESLNLSPTRDLSTDGENPIYAAEELDVFGGMNVLGKEGSFHWQNCVEIIRIK